MRILIVSALFPPDVADPAPYVKALATRLAHQHDVTVLTYGNIPEAIAGVEIVTVSKSTSLPHRLWQFFTQLKTAAHKTDLVLLHNAPATELPALFAQLFSPAKWYLVHSDTKISYRGWRHRLHKLVLKRIPSLATSLPLPRPEQHPFRPPSEVEWKQYETSWQTHLEALDEETL